MKNLQKEQYKIGSYNWDQFFWISPQLRKKLNWNETHIGCIMTRSAGTRSGLWVKQSRKVTARTIFVFQRSERPWLFMKVAVKTRDRTLPTSYLFGIDHRAEKESGSRSPTISNVHVSLVLKYCIFKFLDHDDLQRSNKAWAMAWDSRTLRDQ